MMWVTQPFSLATPFGPSEGGPGSGLGSQLFSNKTKFPCHCLWFRVSNSALISPRKGLMLRP